MIHLRIGAFSLLGLLAIHAPLPAETWLDRAANAGLIVRKSFVGVKEEKLPANFSYVNSDLFGDFEVVDLAIKWQRPEFTPFGSTLLISPFAEWHKSTKDSSETEKASLGISAEWLLREENSPILILKASGDRDLKEDKTSASASLLATFLSTCKFGPGGPIRRSDESLAFRYYPYIGVEYYDKLQLKARGEEVSPEVSGSFGAARLYAEWFPFNRTKREGRFQIVATYTHRWRLGGSAELESSNSLLQISMTYYLDDKQRVGLAYEFEDGDSPVNNFLEDRKTTVGLIVKLGGT